MDVVADLPAGAQPPEPVQQREGLLHDPPVGAQAGTMFRATSGDHRGNALLPHLPATPGPRPRTASMGSPTTLLPTRHAARVPRAPRLQRRQPAPLTLMAAAWSTTTRPGKMHSRGEGNGPGMARSVCGAPLDRQGRFAFPFGNDLRPPLTAESLHPLRSGTKGEAGACRDRTRAIPCKVQGMAAHSGRSGTGEGSQVSCIMPPPRRGSSRRRRGGRSAFPRTGLGD